MKKYTYKTQIVGVCKRMEPDGTELDRVLNKLGQDGWELTHTVVAMVDMGVTHSVICLFRREVTD